MLKRKKNTQKNDLGISDKSVCYCWFVRNSVCQHACVLTYENRSDICIAPNVYVGIYDWKIKLKLGVVFCMPLGLVLFDKIIFQKLCFDLTFNCI